MKYLSTLLTLLATSFLAYAQDVEMADGLRAEGKIYVVVAILGLILAGMILYLFLIDRKVSRLEKRLKENAK